MTGATLRRLADGSIELRVNGVFVMDDVETTSEMMLAQTVLDAGARNILVGGLGLGFTVRALLASAQVTRVVVAELHQEIADWMRDGTIPGANLLADPRTHVMVEDVRATIGAAAVASLDAIVLDVDNGPDFLVHDTNAALYGPDFLFTCAERLVPSGCLCIWSMRQSGELTDTLNAAFTSVCETSVPVRLQDRDEHYWIFTASSPR